ncbi:3-ketoacyl-ACP reductase [Chitinophaga japonensis]|uniref:NAD(P)-dependent dehydrogenase (Short-subunit alcohol dehydrogenase family) n=1 Tax=Chitinophaga japonensis TaxID=104662 RepID=A0A562ST72_CHIJA|nr:3-ketoacyl-ACP reductase [Chitinophaga japonensis]TWI83970.1 NAD(P)-dependent dehydrogenase (short-subunit alcohol dehydrogenase family) [Chitinophaga japonensis]
MKVALITGGSRGIGLGIARELAAKGFDLAINGLRPREAVQDVISELAAYKRQVLYCQADIADGEQRRQLLQDVAAHYGCLHVLVNNAGVAPKERKDVLEATEESFDHVLSTNLKGPYFLTQAAANWMISQQQADRDFRGCIINISSISATVASVNRGEYCLAKAALSMATQLFAVRLGSYNIPVYEVRPGIIATDMTAGVKEKYDQLIASGLCVQPRWGFPEDVGKAVAALAGGDFPYSTGQVIMVDGGLSLPRL